MNAPSDSRPTISVRWAGWLLLAIILSLATVCPAADMRLDLTGPAIQGGLVTGRIDPQATVAVDGRAVRVSEDGRFVFGIGRDDGPEVRITTRLPGKTARVHRLPIKTRKYIEERVDGLPPDRVSPKPETLVRIRREAKQARTARTIDDPRIDFAQPFIWPVIGRISGVYGSRRVLNGEPRRPHFGVDIARPTGTPVRAPAPGRITLAHPGMFFSGKTVILDHGHGVSSTFLHLNRIRVKVGDRVAQGDIVAEVGATGRVSGPHLDWRMNWFDRRIDPMLVVGPMPKK